MSFPLALVLALLVPQDHRGELSLPNSSRSGVQITRDGALWIGGRDGRVHVSRDRAASWSEVEMPTEKCEPVNEWGRVRCEGGDDTGCLRWFDELRGILPLRGDRAFVTGDGGASWREVGPIGVDRPADCQATPDGRAWVLGVGGGLVATVDFGGTWEDLVVPVPPGDRIASFAIEEGGTALVGTSREVLVSEDACRTWRTLAIEPSGSGSEHDSAEGAQTVFGGPSGTVRKVRRSGDFVMASTERVLLRRLSSDDGWVEVEIDGAAVRDFETHGTGWIVLTEEDALVSLADDGVPHTRFAESLEGFGPLSRLTAGSRRIALFDGISRLALWDGGELLRTRLYSSDERWPLRQVDRAADGTLWGLSRFYLYRSRDEGARWERVADAADVRSIHLQADGSPLLVGFSGVRRWDPATGELRDVRAFEHMYRTRVLRRGRTWFAHGGLVEDVQAYRDLMSGTHSRFTADFVTGRILVSLDGGTTWSVLYDWPGGAIENLAWTPDGTLFAYRVPGGLARGELDLSGEDPAHEMTVLVDPSWESPIDLDYGRRMAFADARRGWMRGGDFYGDTYRLETADGGETWTKVATESPRDERYFQLDDGPLVRFVVPPGNRRATMAPYMWRVLGGEEDRPPGAFERWNGEDWEPLWKPETYLEWARVDSAGRLLAALRGGELWSSDGAAFEPIR